MGRIEVSKADLLEQINDGIRRLNCDDRSCDDCQIENIRQRYEDRKVGEANWDVPFARNCGGCNFQEVINELSTKLDVDWR